jgi:hypothetical protein
MERMMKTIVLTDHEFYALILELGLNYDHQKGRYINLPEVAEDASDSLRKKLRAHAGISEGAPLKKEDKKRNKVWDAIKDMSKG